MIKMKIILCAVAFSSIILCSCTNQHKEEIEKTEWLIGTWENKTGRGSIYETWSKINNKELSGKSYAIKEIDTIVFEVIQLIQKQNNLWYIPKVKKQNEGMPVHFALKTISDSILVFENAQHDFPQIISYVRISADSLIAEISGTKSGQLLKQSFPMKRLD